MINIPNKNPRKWSQPNNSDLFGNIYVTKNISFDKEGYLKLSNSPRAFMNPTVNADWDNIASITYNAYLGRYFMATWDMPFNIGYDNISSFLSERPELITDVGVPSTDIETGSALFGGKLVVTQDTDVDYDDTLAGSWVDTNITLTAGGQHQVINFLSLSALAIANINTVLLYASPISATPTLITTLTIPSDFEITGMAYLNQNLYIGTKHKYGGHAFLFVWNGSGSASQQAYEVDANGIIDVCAHKGTVACLVTNGDLMMYNGGGLVSVARFPMFYENQNLTDYTNKTLYKNMMRSNGDVLYINFTNTENETHQLIDQPDGVWCYDENVGLYHRYSGSISLVDIKQVQHTAINVSTNIITTTNVPITGTEVYMTNGGTDIVGITEHKKYFVIKVSSTEFKLATTKANALAGVAVDITSVVNPSYFNFSFFPNMDYGSFINSRTFALQTIEKPNNNTQYGIDLIWSSELRTRTLSSTNDEYGMTVSDGVESRGYFVTPKILSNEVTDTFNNFTLKFKKLGNELDKIIIKYRTQDDTLTKINLEDWQATWTSTNTFTTTQEDMANAEVGDEIEFLQGAGAGLLAHITDISENTGTYTITIDDTFDNYTSGDLAKFVFRNWIKLDTISYGSMEANDGYYSKEIGATGKFIQFKIELRGIGVLIEELLVNNITQLPS